MGKELLEPLPPSIFDRIIAESDRLQRLDSISAEQLRPLKELIYRAASSHRFTQGQLVQALEQIEQSEEFGNTMLHLWINTENKAEQLEARCIELEQHKSQLRHDNNLLRRMLATAHGERLTGTTYH